MKIAEIMMNVLQNIHSQQVEGKGRQDLLSLVLVNHTVFHY